MRDVVTHLGGFADDHSHAVIDEEAAADGGSGMNFDSRKPARELRQSTGQEEPAVFPQPVVDAVPPQRVQAGVEQHDLQLRARRGIALQHRGNVFAHQAKVVTHGLLQYVRADEGPPGLNFESSTPIPAQSLAQSLRRATAGRARCSGSARRTTAAPPRSACLHSPGARPNSYRRDHRSARRDAHQQAFFDGEAARHHQRVVAGDLHHFVDVVGTQNARNEAGADALNLVRRRLSAGKHRALDRLDCDRLERWLASA